MSETERHCRATPAQTGRCP